MGAEYATENEKACNIDIVICVNDSKKNREENKFPSRVEVRFVAPKAFGVVIERWALVPLFLRCFFLCCFLSFLCHRLYSPLSIRKVRRSVKSWELTSLTRVQ
jgi:hypothetical protein